MERAGDVSAFPPTRPIRLQNAWCVHGPAVALVPARQLDGEALHTENGRWPAVLATQQGLESYHGRTRDHTSVLPMLAETSTRVHRNVQEK
jgi:hypothetical protein